MTHPTVSKEFYIVKRRSIDILNKKKDLPKRSIYRFLIYELLRDDMEMNASHFLKLKTWTNKEVTV